MSVIVPELDLAPSVTSRVVTIDVIDMQEGAPAGGSVDFILAADLHVPADDKIIQAGSVTVTLDAAGHGEVRLPTYDPDVRPDGWGILVKKSWAPHPYLIRIPVGTTPISLADIEPVQEADPGLVQWLLTGASATVVEGSPAAVSVNVAGGVAAFAFTLPPGDAATLTALSRAMSAPGVGTSETDTPGYAIALSDVDGRVAGGVDERGRWRTETSPVLPDGSFTADVLGAGMGALDPSTGFVWGVRDIEGHLGVGVRANGAFWGGVSSRVRLNCVGDSLVRGYTNSAAWPLEDAFPALMESLLPGVTITNSGFGGNTIDDVRVRMGMLPIYFDEVTIPASGPVELTTTHTPGCGIGVEFFGALGPVVGSLVHDSPGQWTFTRSAAGEETALTSPRFVCDRGDFTRDTTIVWVGRNDVNQQQTGPEGDVVEHVLAGVRGIVDWLAVQDRHYLVVSLVNRPGDEPSGTPGYAQVLAINEGLRTDHRGRYVDVRSWLIHDALDALEMTPNQADLDAIAADAPPPSVMDSGSHYIQPVAPLLAQRFHDELTRRGWF